MSRLLILPVPLSSSSLAVAQLITDPTHAETISFSSPSKPECQQPSIQSKYQSIITQDQHGRFVSSTSRPSSTHDNQITLQAEQSSHTSLAQPRTAFNTLRDNAAAQSFLRKSALQRQPLYYVTGIQTLKNPSFQRVGSEHARIAEAPASQIRLPMHVRRVDSAFGLDNTRNADDKSDESIFAVELLKVRCRVGAASEPHSVEDIDYEWSYHPLEDGHLQLSIGLGKALSATELRALAGMADEEDFTDKSWDSQSEDEDDGIGGF